RLVQVGKRRRVARRREDRAVRKDVLQRQACCPIENRGLVAESGQKVLEELLEACFGGGRAQAEPANCVDQAAVWIVKHLLVATFEVEAKAPVMIQPPARRLGNQQVRRS